MARQQLSVDPLSSVRGKSYTSDSVLPSPLFCLNLYTKPNGSGLEAGDCFSRNEHCTGYVEMRPCHHAKASIQHLVWHDNCVKLKIQNKSDNSKMGIHRVVWTISRSRKCIAPQSVNSWLISSRTLLLCSRGQTKSNRSAEGHAKNDTRQTLKMRWQSGV